MLEHLFTLVMLILLQAVLGFDNLLYISLESKRAPVDEQKRVRVIGIAIAIVARIVLLVILLNVIDLFKDPWFGAHWTGVVEGEFNVHSLIVLGGGVFILYTAMKEIWHMIRLENHDHTGPQETTSANTIICWIVVMNLVFSFDSILSAMSLTENVWVMAIAIVSSGLMMILMANTVSEFLHKNRMYEVLGLFILFIVGIMLLTEGAHLAHLKLAGNAVEQMSKTTFYFVIGVLVLTDIVQSRYQRKLLAKAAAAHPPAGESA